VRYRTYKLGGIEIKDSIVNGIEHWGFVFIDQKNLGANLDTFMHYLMSNGEVIGMNTKHIDIYRLAPFLSRSELRALKAAYDLGFFDESRKSTLSKVTDALGLSPTTVNYEIRRGINKLSSILLRDNQSNKVNDYIKWYKKAYFKS
jgi:predicted DNA binding protein